MGDKGEKRREDPPEGWTHMYHSKPWPQVHLQSQLPYSLLPSLSLGLAGDQAFHSMLAQPRVTWHLS